MLNGMAFPNELKRSSLTGQKLKNANWTGPFAGSLKGLRARKGVFITTFNFPPHAVHYVRRLKEKPCLLMASSLTDYDPHNGGVAPTDTFTLKRLGDFHLTWH
jgi:restriction endonuclease Mrr